MTSRDISADGPAALWAPGAATGAGSLPAGLTSALPGTSAEIEDACRLVFDEAPDLPYLPELPHRGPGADLIGRGALALTDLHIDLQPAGWRLVTRPGRDERRARDLLERDLDALEAIAVGYAGPLKLQLAGPWTLAASLELGRGDKALSDPGAVRDIAESLGDGAAAHVARVRRRVPGARVLLAFDEPLLPQVLTGRLPTASGFGSLPQPAEGVAEARLAAALGPVLAAGAAPGVHCCAADPPVELMRQAGAAFVSLDLTLGYDEEEVGDAVEAGIGLMAGLVPTGPAPIGSLPNVSEVSRTVEPVLSLWRRLGLAVEQLREVAVSPTCGLAGAHPEAARAVMKLCREAGKRLAEGEL
jgi:hypothetical protein